MFVDRVKVRVTAGNGGNGCQSFRREKYVPRGGPDGGDGGNGGSVFFVADSRNSSLLNLRYHSIWKGKSGVHGKGADCHGKNGEDVLLPVPLGTQVCDAETGEGLIDLVEEGQRFLAAHGGRGGRGNARFVTSTNRAPHFAEKGEPGEHTEFVLELKVIAEVGLVGLPNAGKSTFLAAVTAARPKIANYPFTTLSPNLGVATLSDFRTLTIADIPGLIEGAASGKGLGHDFLRHIERTKVLLFLIDLGDEHPIATRDTLEKELSQYSEAFAARPRVYVLNKADIPENRDRYPTLTAQFDEPWLISGATGEGMQELIEHLWALVERLRAEGVDTLPETAQGEYVFEPKFNILREDEAFRVESKLALRAVRMTDFNNEEAIRHLHRRFQKMGLVKALKRMGAEEGAIVRFGDVALEYHSDEE